MHGATLAGRSGRPGGALRRAAGGSPVEDGASALDAACALRSRWRRRRRSDGGGINRPGPCLRHNDAARSRGGLGRSSGDRGSRTGFNRLGRRRDRSGNRSWSGGRRRGNDHRPGRRRGCCCCNDGLAGRSSWSYDRGCSGNNWRLSYNRAGGRFGGNRRRRGRWSDDRSSGARLRNDPAGRGTLGLSRRWSRPLNRSRGGGHGCCWASSNCRRCDGRGWSRSGGGSCSYGRSRDRPGRRGCGFLLSLLESFEHISGLGDTRKVNFRFGSRIGARAGRCARPHPLKVSAHTIGFVELKRTGVRLLLSNTHVIENIENSLALNFQFAR